MQDYSRFSQLTYDEFRKLADDDALSPHERIGFPDTYRAGYEEAIYADICQKLVALVQPRATIVDIGSGCSGLPINLMRDAETLAQELILVDSAEMHRRLPENSRTRKVVGRFPECPELLAELAGRVDAVLVYSVLQYVFAEDNVWRFVDAVLSLLSVGGRALIGDIPNVSMRKRLFASDTGKRLHRNFTGRDEDPVVAHGRIEAGQIDDAVVIGIISRCRAAGFHAYLVPQDPKLPMANRREDILIERP